MVQGGPKNGGVSLNHHTGVVSFSNPHNKWDPPENNGPPPLTLGPEVQLC